MKNKAIIMVLVLLMGVMMVGCGASGTDSNTNTNGDSSTDNNGQTASENEIVIEQYFASKTYVMDGQDEENGELMPPVEYTLTCEAGDNQYLEAVNSLKTLPQEGEGYYTMVSDDYTINDVTVDDGVAYVDFASENLEGGSSAEVILIDQIVYTLANSFEDVAAVQFTVDGQRVETLMGDVDISEPISADYL